MTSRLQADQGKLAVVLSGRRILPWCNEDGDSSQFVKSTTETSCRVNISEAMHRGIALTLDRGGLHSWDELDRDGAAGVWEKTKPGLVAHPRRVSRHSPETLSTTEPTGVGSSLTNAHAVPA